MIRLQKTMTLQRISRLLLPDAARWPGFAACTLALAASFARAASEPEGPIFDLPPFVHTAQVTEGSILPTALDSSAILGFPTGIVDTPRAVSIVTLGQLQDKNILRAEDLDQFISGAYSAPIFGNIGVPMMRAELGETYQNGQRRAFNRNSFPVSFNGVEAVEAVKGAAPAVFGYGNATGGYINLVTKRPHRDETKGTVRLVAGSWDHYRWQADVGGPINQEWAYRFSYEGLDSDSFYRGVENRSQSLFAALSFRPSQRFSIDFNAEYLDADFTEIPGTNRPTQDLIDHGLYITGESISQGAPFYGNTFTPTGTVRIDGSQVLLAPGDVAYAKVFNAQAIATWRGERWTVTSRSYFEDIEAQRGSAYYFFSHLPKSHTFEERLEFLTAFNTGNIRHRVIFGGSFRYETRRNYADIFNEYFNAFDVTGDPDTLRYPLDQLFGVLPVPGTEGFAIPGGAYPREGGGMTTSLSATHDSRVTDYAVFAQDSIQLAPRWSVLLGARLDNLRIRVEDPLPQPGFDPVNDRTAKGIWSGTASLTYKAASWLSYYATLNSSAAVESSSSSGGFGFSNNRIPDEVLENNSELAEVGSKMSLLGDQLFLGTALYYQKRNRISPRSGLPDEIEIFGVEWDLVYQPNKHFNAGLVASYGEGNYINGPVSGTPSTQAPFDPSRPSSTFPQPPLDDYRLPGLPRWLANGYLSYTTSLGVGTSVLLHWQSKQNLDLEGYVVIPAQVRLDLALFYKTERFEFRVDLINATDEFNWRPTATPFAGADLVTRELPRHLQVSSIFRF